ncbi:hypothetical protein H6F46_12110 [Limnothrix sp. FACHB-1083]|uniref:beta strand repeat-containing protein n=1 Tax=unclassified Limnothrix TaxID=2632864 RepID=UPI001680073F|nr:MULTISPECIES: hypothetical protein [unclassified Limnothrix]MBD2161435.1 hypothetical protein [Limnothrix sp. FACHB-1083]MBD2192054.1 hypothetical protein [Limnothrix sp. FACHB-1088]
MPDQFDITVSDLETLPGADLQDGDRLLVSRPGAFDKTVTWGAVKEELGVGVDLTALQAQVAGKANAIHQHSPIDILQRGEPNGFATLDATGKIPILQIPDGIGGGSVGGIEDVPGLQTALDGKAPITHTQGISTITGLQTALDGKAPSVHSHVIADVTGLQPALDARVLSSTVGQPSGVASLGSDGKIPPGQIPSLAIGETFVVASEAAMLALTAQQGDVARRTDTGQTFILQTEPASTLANWVQISATTSVSSVNGDIGDVILTITDIPGLQTALDSKAATAHVHSGADITSGLVSVARLGAGTPSAANYLRGDGSWVAPNVAAITGLQTALDEKLATASNAASQGLVLTATGATAWEWKQPSGGGGTPVDANGHPVIGGVAPVAAVDWRGGVSEVVSGFPAFSGTTSAYRANSRRLYVTAATARLHYAPDAAGLLAEGQIRNYCAYNTSVTGWTVVSATVAATSGVNNPGGTAGAVQVGSTLSGGYTQQSVVSVPTEGAGNYAVSGFFRAGSASVVTLWLSGDNGTTFSRCAFDLTTGIATPDNSAIVPSNIRVERYPNGWWYVGFVANLASVANTRIRIYPGGLAGAVGTVVFWGTQIAPAGYVPNLGTLTTTAVATKVIDTRSSTLSTPLTPADSASIYAELYPGAAVDGCLFALGATTGSKPRIEIRRTASGDGGLIRAFNTAGVQVYSQSITLGTGLTRIALSAGSDSTLIAVNGTTFAVAASLDWLAMTRVAVGTDIDLLNSPAGALFLRLLLYPSVFSIENLSGLSLGGSIGGGSGGSGGGGSVTLPIAISDVSGLTAVLDGKLDDSQLAQPSGVASLDPSGLVPVAQLPIVTTSIAGAMTAADKAKLDGVAAGATANATDAQLRDRATHTGTQAIATITGLQAALDAKAASVHTHIASDITSGTFTTARLGSGTANAGAYLRGDSSWQALNVAAVSGLQAALDAKAALTHTHVISDVTGLQAALDARVLTSSLGVSGGVATLDGTGKIPNAQLPALAITEVFTVASEAAMLALAAQTGDLARRTDVSRTFILTAEPATTLSNWVEWLIPPDIVTSVAGKTGAVTLAIADTVGLQAALDGKSALSHTHAAADVTSGVFASARLGTGSPSAANYLRGDGAWAAIAQSDVTGLVTALSGKLDTTARGAANGVASLDASTLIPSAQIPTLALSKLSTSGATTGQVVTFDGSAIVWSTAAGGGNLAWTVRIANATLSANENCVADGSVTELTLPASASGSHNVINDTTAAITIVRGGTATISGIARSTGAAIAATDRVRILPGQRGVFIASGGNWIAQGCEPPSLVFAYGGTPLANNPQNPNSAHGLFHWLGGGSGSYVNPVTNGVVIAATSGELANTVANLTDRVASGQNVHTSSLANSWRGWQFQKQFRCTGFWIQLGGIGGSDPRSFALRVNTGTGLSSATEVTNWTLVQSWTGQSQLTGVNNYFFFPVTTPVSGNQLALIQTAANSNGSLIFVFQEIELFGEYEP